jgi:hypothetical protein
VIASVVDSHLGTILGTYVVVFASFGLLAWRLVARGRRLARDVAVEDRPWT